MDPLNGRRALVTGGTRGIGRAITQKLLEAGCSVTICGRDPAAVERAVAELGAQEGVKIFGISADVTILEDVRRLIRFAADSMGGLDILVNNAGIGIFSSVAEMSVEDWRRTINTNLTGVFYCCHEALPLLKASGAGYIVNLSSLAGKNPFAGGAAYNASKFGLNGFSEAMMLDHRYDNIRVTYVMPGSVDTEFSPRAPSADANWKIAATDVADMILAVLRMPERTLVSRLEIRPAKPKR